MTALIITLSSILSLALLLFLLYILLFVRPRARRPKNESLLCDYAHRGLHGRGVPENSLKAFELACEAGKGIELDVQLSRDGEVMVFHDYNLKRMTGRDSLLSDMDAEELKQMLAVKTGARDFDEWIKAFCNRKYNSDFSREMTRSVEVFLADYRD